MIFVEVMKSVRVQLSFNLDSTAIFQPVIIPYIVNEEQGNVIVCFFSEEIVNISLRIATHDVTAISEWIIFTRWFSITIISCR